MSERRNVRGGNWGVLSLENQQIQFQNRDKEIFNIPINKVMNSMVNKQDLILELNTDDLDNGEDMISEIRFFAPQEAKKKLEGEEEEDEKEDEEEDMEDKHKFIKDLNKQIQKEAKIGINAGESIATFSDVALQVPRGKYTVDFHKTSIKFHGSSYNYTIEYKNIARTFLLPQSDEVNVAFVISLTKPIKQGNTIHPFIVINFKKQSQISITLKTTQEDIESHGWQVDYPLVPLEGATNEIFATLFKKIVKVVIFIPGNFKSIDEQKSISCSVKTSQGWFFPLQKSIIFINKPVIYIPHKEILVAEFDRVAQGQKMFDIKIYTRQKMDQLFTGFEKKELPGLMEYFRNAKINVKTTEPYVEEKQAEIGNLLRGPRGEGKRQIKHKAVTLNPDEDDDDDEDSDFGAENAEESSSDGEDDEDVTGEVSEDASDLKAIKEG